ncbi:FLYWCH zinc finger domain-containing protein [Phthorimaea operculella]|nr:FLYWCH zinc finger domain-containing protein [Phthorimaea operculella]
MERFIGSKSDNAFITSHNSPVRDIDLLVLPYETIEFIPRRRGKSSLVYKGYTFHMRSSGNIWYCSKTPSGCFAKVVTKDREFVHALDETIEFIPRQRGKFNLVYKGHTFYNMGSSGNRWYCSKKPTTGCEAKVVTRDREFVQALNETIEFIPRRRGKFNLVYKGHTFYNMGSSGNRWYCSKKPTTGCEAKVVTRDREFVQALSSHNHPPPTLYRTPDGKLHRV